MGTAVDYSPSSMEYSRFYAVRLFDDARPQFTTAGGATAYDAAALSDANLVNASSSTAVLDLERVVHRARQLRRRAHRQLGLHERRLRHLEHPAAEPGADARLQRTLPLDSAYTYQADATGGGIQCGSSGGTTSTPPRGSRPEHLRGPAAAALVLSVNATTGQVRTAGSSSSPARVRSRPPRRDRHGGDGALARRAPAVHDCRHDGNCSN
jgi:hypothetical protein